MYGLSLFIAMRYLRGTRHEKNSAVMVRICFLSIFIGTFALALVAAIMHGFEKATITKMQGIHPQLIMRTNGDHFNMAAINDLCADLPAIAAWAPSDEQNVILQDGATQAMLLKGIDPLKEARTTALHEKLIAGATTLEHALRKNRLIIGERAARAGGIGVGDTVTLLFSRDEITGRKITLTAHNAVIGGIFKTGIEEFDANTLFCSLDFLKNLFPDADITTIGIKLRDDADEQTVIEQLQQYCDTAHVTSWKSLYLPLLSALKLEKYGMFLILALITLVAGMNIISLLFMQITQKRGEIALLQALGCSQKNIISIFLYVGMLIAGAAALLGLAAALAACWFLERYPCLELPDVYYVTHVPAKMEPIILVTVFGLVMVLSFVATYLPTRRIKTMNISQILRFEG